MNEEKSGVNFANNDLQPEKFLPSRSLQPHVQPCKLKIRHASFLTPMHVQKSMENSEKNMCELRAMRRFQKWRQPRTRRDDPPTRSAKNRLIDRKVGK